MNYSNLLSIKKLNCFFVLLLYLFPNTSFTQKDSLISEGIQIYEPSAIKFSLSHLFSPTIPGIHIAFEHPGKDGFYWRHQVGTFLNFGYTDQKAIEDIKGVRLRSGLRKYKTRNVNTRNANFWEISVDYRYIDLLIAADFDRAGFSQRLNYNMWQSSLSFNAIWGITAKLGKHLHLDFGAGAGIRINYRKFSPIPDDAVFSTNGSVYLTRYGNKAGFKPTLSVPIILSLGYVW